MRIAVKNLPVKVEEREIWEFFSKKGRVTDVFMLRDSRGVFRRIAFVGFAASEEAKEAIEYFDGAMFKNHKIALEEAKEDSKEVRRGESTMRKILYHRRVLVRNLRPETDLEIVRKELMKVGGKIILMEKVGESQDSLSLLIKFADGTGALRVAKSVRVLAGMRVRVAAYDEDYHKKEKEYYNSLFFSFDAVLKQASEATRLEKRAIVDVSDSLLGSKMALMETALVEQTKDFLAQHRIVMDRITGEKNRKVLIVKCPDILGAIDLVRSKCRVEIAPSRSLALLFFEDEKGAEECKARLNMKRLKSYIIYCEYVPLCEMTGEDERVVDVKADALREKSLRKTSKVVVKNVPFQATVADLKAIFGRHATDIRLPLKDGKRHRGFAFLVADSAKSAEEIIEKFGVSTHLFGRRLVLERAKV